MKILWLGMVASNEMFVKMPVRTIGQASAHAAQNSILRGMDNNGIPVDTISAHNYPTYPIYPHKFVQGERWTRNGISRDICVGFLNLKYYNHFSKARSLRKAVQEWFENNSKEDEIHLVVYSLHSPLLYAANFAKKIKPVQIHIIVPDIPKYVDVGSNRLKKYLKSVDWFILKALLKNVNKYILFTKQMADFMEIQSGKWIVIEGSVNDSEISINNDILTNPGKKVVIMYAGVIDKYRGIIELLEAFGSIKDENYELWLAGSGSADPYVKERAKADKRIKHLGYITNRNNIIELEHKASILINTGLPNDEVSKYCFPSKLFEYMASGNPVISIKTQGIPEEYFNYITEMKSLEQEDILSAIHSVMGMSYDERKKYGSKAREFILLQKNQNIQAKKLIDFIIH